MIARDLKILENVLRRPVSEKDFLLVTEKNSPVVRVYYCQTLRLTVVISTKKEACIKQLTSKAAPTVIGVPFGKTTYYAAIE